VGFQTAILGFERSETVSTLDSVTTVIGSRIADLVSCGWGTVRVGNVHFEYQKGDRRIALRKTLGEEVLRKGDRRY
jgi:hypothetical protein